MTQPSLSPKFLLFLEDYAKKTGKAPAVIIEEAVSQAILRHETTDQNPSHTGLLMPPNARQQLLACFPEFGATPGSETAFGDFMERLPDRSWTYQIGRLEEWWFLVVSREPREFAEPLELRSVETSQAYAWLFGYTKQVRLWSATDRFLLVF